MRRHLLLLTFTLILSHFSILNLWAGEQYIFPVTSASTVSGGKLNKDSTTGQWYATLTNYDDYVDIPFTWDQSGTECLIKIGYTTAVSGGQVRLWFYRGGSDCGSFGEHGIEVASVITEKDCGAQLTTSKIDGCKPYVLRIKPAASKTMNVYYLKVETNNGAVQSTADITAADLNLVYSSTVGDGIPSNSDFLYSHKSGDKVKIINKDGKNQMTATNSYITAASRKLYTFETGTYKFKFNNVYTEETSTYGKPCVFVNNVAAGGGTYYFNKDDASAGGKYRDWEVEIDVAAGTYPVEFYFPNSTEKLFYTTVTVTKNTPSCPGYTFHYGTSGQSDWVTPLCFTQVDATTEWQITDFVIPNKPNWYVGYQGVFKGSGSLGTNSASSYETNWATTMYLAPAMDPSDESGTPKVGSSAAGAIGTIRIYSNSNWNNLYAAFIPDGYGITYGGSGHAFTETATANMWETDVLTLPDVSSTYYMGMETETEGTYVKYGKSKSPDEAISNMGVTVKGNGGKAIYLVPGSFNADGAKYAVYDVTNSSFDTDFMSDTDGDGIYVGYVGDNCASIVLCRMKSDATTTDLANKNWDGARWNQTNNISISGDLAKKYTITNLSENNCSYSTDNMQPITGQKGKFRMWANSKADNWFVHWIPYYTLSYDGNGGSGSTAQTVRNCESSTLTVSVASNGFTAPTGHEFAGWNTLAGGGGDLYAAGASYTLTANRTLYAQWSPLSYTVTLNTNGGTINADDVTSYTYGTGATLPTDVTKTGYDFEGWYDNSGLTGDRVYNIANDATGDKAYWAKWTPKVYNITYMDGASEFAGTHEDGYPTTHTYGTATTLKSATKAGYTLEGWYTEAQLTNKVTSLGATAYTTDITLYANWTPTSTVSTPTVSAASDTYSGTPIDISLSATSSACSNPVVVFFVNDGTTTFEVTGAPYGSDGNGAVGTVNGSAPYTTVHKATFTATKAATYTVTAKLYEGLLLANFDNKDFSGGGGWNNNNGSHESASNPSKQSVNGSTTVHKIIRGATNWWDTPLYWLVTTDAHNTGRTDYRYIHTRQYRTASGETKWKANNAKGDLTAIGGISFETDTWQKVVYDNNTYLDFMFPLLPAEGSNTFIYIDDIILSNESSMTVQATSSSASRTIDLMTYAIATSATNGSVSVVSSAAEGDEVTITATPSGGYEFSSWTITKTSDGSDITASVSLSGQTSSATFTMPAYGVTVTATFAEITCWSSRTYQVEDIMITTAGAVTNHDTQATPSNVKIITSENQNYDSNTDDYFASISDGAFVYNTQAYSAVYMEVDIPSAGNYTLDVYSGKGQDKNVWVNVYTTTYNSGDNISYGGTTYYKQYNTQLNKDYSTYAIKLSDKNGESGVDNKAYPVGKCIIGIYTGNANCALDKIVLTRVDDSEVFCKHTITVNSTSGASSSATADKSKALSGETVTVTAYAASDGYRFTGWTATSGTVTFANASSLSTTFVMPDENVTVQANYVVDTKYTVHYEVVGGNGTISAEVKSSGAAVSDGDEIATGTILTFTATPNSGYSVMGWYTWIDPTETRQGVTRATTFDYNVLTDITIRVKFVPIMIALGDENNIGTVSSEFDGKSSDGSSLSASAVEDANHRFNHDVLQYSYNMKSTSSYYGIGVPHDVGYTTSVASGATGIGFWYRTEDDNDHVLMYPKLYNTSTSSWQEVQLYLPATDGKWKYMYVANTDNFDVTVADAFGFYLNGEKEGKTVGKLNTNCKFWLAEVKPITVSDVTVNSNEEKSIPMVVRDLTIYQGGQVTNEDDILITRNIYYHRPAKDDGTSGKLSNKLDQWYTFAVPFTVTDIEVNESSTWYDINAVYYSDNATDQSANEPDGNGHFYLQYLSATNVSAMGEAFADRWKYITPDHSLYLDADAADWDGSRYGYPMKDSAYIILFDSTDPSEMAGYWTSNPEVRFIGGAQTIDGTAKEWTVEESGEKFFLYANNTLHSFTLTGSAYVLNDAGTNFDLQETPTIRPFECYVQGTDELKAKYESLPMRRPGGGGIVTGMEKTGLEDSVQVIKVIEDGRLIIIRNGRHYNAMGARVK